MMPGDTGGVPVQARCVVTGGLVIAAFLAALDPAAAQVLEVRRTVLPATDAPGATWTPIEFTDPFEAPPVVLVTPVGSIGDDPFTVRVRAVTAEGFEALAVEAAGTDGPRGETDIAWLAVTPGVYNLGDGGFLEAGRLEVAVEQLGPAHGQAGETVPLRFDAPFREPPALLTQVMTAENESGNVPRQPARPFLTVAQTEVRVGGASIALERCPGR